MTLKEIIAQEERLLIIENAHKHELTLNEVVRLKRYMRIVSEVTDVYFDLINSYHCNIKEEKPINETTSEIINEMYSYNDMLQQSEVDSDLINMNEIIGFINIISEKYNIVFCEENKVF